MGVLNALPLQLALCELRPHVVGVDEWPVQREGTLWPSHFVVSASAAAQAAVLADCSAKYIRSEFGTVFHVVQTKRPVFRFHTTFQWRFSVQKSQIFMPHVQQSLVAGRAHTCTQCARPVVQISSRCASSDETICHNQFSSCV